MGAEGIAVLTMELQRGIAGDLSPFVPLREAAAPVLPNIAAVCAAVRAHGGRVVHCTFTLRADRAGTPINTRMMARQVKDPAYLLEGTPVVEIVPEIGPDLTVDLVSNRSHGMTPFTGTSLDVTLRALGVHTVVATGVSVNIGVFGMTVEALGLGYRVVIPTDCVAGLPADYATAVLQHSLAPIAELTDSAALVTAWAS